MFSNMVALNTSLHAASFCTIARQQVSAFFANSENKKRKAQQNTGYRVGYEYNVKKIFVDQILV